MKKSVLALAVLGAVAGVAQAQTAVTIYGALDVGVIKVKNQTTAIGRGDNNKLGFKGVEDLGGGLSALFQIELRFEPDTGTTESAPNRPLFQGQSRVGLKGDFGTIRLGRGLSSIQETLPGFEPWSFDANRANLSAFSLAGYNGDPLTPGSSQNRFSNAIFYNSPLFSGFQVNGSLSTKETLPSGGTPLVNPYSLSGTYNNGPFAAYIGYERSAIETKFWSLGGTYTFSDWKFIATYAQQKIDITDQKTKGAVLGLNYNIGSGVILAGYGRNKPDNAAKTDQFSIGYEHKLSKRTFLYVDAFNKRAPGVSNVNTFDLGIHHNF